MPFCPKCKAEYREGFVMCADCKVPLVESLDKKKHEEVKSENPNEALFMSFDDYARLTEEDDFGSAETKINVEGESNEDIENQAFVSRVSKEPSPEEIEKIRQELIKREMAEKQEAEYVSKKDKAGEYLSTGIMLIVMGALGCIFIALLLAGVLPLKVHGLVSIIIDVIMFLFFAMFIYFGIHSLTRYKDYKVKSVDENKENEEFEEWFKKTITMSFIDSDLEITDDEQTNFFKRNAKIKYLISQEFPNVSESLADLMIDKYYGDIFE